MEKIKIISNPYKQRNDFYSFDDGTNEWQKIDRQNCPKSQLLSDDLIKGFFPFKVKEIIDIFVEEYGVGSNGLEITFEGTPDDFKELMSVCYNDKYDCEITLKNDGYYLINAREVLPKIVQVFTDLRPIIDSSENNKEEIKDNLDRFSDATKDIIPLCVMGNYSAGKSTFINALIGNEILPSGDEPVTAKVFKINQSDNDNYASIELGYDHNDFRIMFINDTHEMIGEINNPLAEKLLNALDELKDKGVVTRINKALSIINRYDAEKTSDLIEVTIPFNKGLLRNSNARFIILDTPGSNSASNVAHLTVLDEAMHGLTNGIPMFVSEYDSLDSFDNKELYDKIKSMKELDSRFTMIVVNKADENNLPEVEKYTKEKQNEIMSQLVPKNLYSEGIFFVSSILGLGSKTDGQFIDKHSNRVFRTMKFLFEDTEDEDYMTLYAYDIMPEQLKTKFIDDCRNTREDLVFVNSGLYAIEREIQTFADKYAAYNKCQQSTLYLNHIIDLTSTEIEETISKREQNKQELINNLEEKKQKLLAKLDNRSVELQQVFEVTYTQNIATYIEKEKPLFTQEEIKEYEIRFKSEQEENLQLDQHEDDVKKSFDSIKKNLSKNVDYAINKLDKESFKKAGKVFVDDVKEAYESVEERNDKRKEVDRIVADKLFELAMNECVSRLNNFQVKTDDYSKSVCNEASETYRKELISIVSDSEVLSEDKKEEIMNIIMTYEDLQFVLDIDKLDIDYFKKRIKIKDVILFDSDNLSIGRLVRKFNQEFNDNAIELKMAIDTSHQNTYKVWQNALLSKVKENIVDYSPKLLSMQKQIDEETQKINELEDRQRKIENSIEYINQLIDWHELEE